ncbi:MAG TPA: PQQ-binding-like beta-propeller repeat protein [Solirubrobacteraceae bacterium]|nr:PQQ-binding-like beta-propeller repeat protein [Solirubrobacteraceae bacterium]
MPPDTPPRMPRRRVLIGAGIVALLVAAAAIAAVVVQSRQGDVSNPDVEFRPESPSPPPPDLPAPTARKDPLDKFVWPVYGRTKDRRRYLPASTKLRPPYRRVWRRIIGVLLEFPPVLAGRRLFLLDDSAVLRALGKSTGRTLWKRRLGRLAASSPAYADGRVFVTILERGRGGAGRVVALRARDGRILWSRDLPSRTETSPLVDQGRVYIGSENGTVYSLRQSDGAVRWTFRASGAVKGGPALWRDKLYFGDYSGRVYALRQADGRPVWQVGTSGARFGFGSGSFYATAAVAFGRVYLGNTDGNVYSFAADSGKLAWRTRTGGYVYSSAAVAQVPGSRPMVYVGSYDGSFYGIDARSGKVRWSHHDGGHVSGGATVVGDLVYFANIRKKTTTALGTRTGRVVYRFPDGAYNPVISDGRTIFLTGNSRIYALQTPETVRRLQRERALERKRQRIMEMRRRKGARR